MGRMRSRRRTDEMNRIKRDRNEKKELARLKKVLGIVDNENDLKDQVMDIAEIKTAAQIRKVGTFATSIEFRVHNHNNNNNRKHLFCYLYTGKT